jgi:5-methylcytosine-specific restriction protein A
VRRAVRLRAVDRERGDRGIIWRRRSDVVDLFAASPELASTSAVLAYSRLMPTRPRSPCAQPRCPNLALPGKRYCALDQPAHYREQDAARGSAARRGYDAAWRRYRAWYIPRHPVCYFPGCGVPTQEIHHVLPVDTCPEFLFTEENCLPCCKRHHSAITAKEQSFGRGGRAC